MRFLLSLTVLFVFAIGACRPPDDARGADDLGVSLTIDLPDDPLVGEAPITVWLERDGAALSGARVELTGDMTHAGMTPVVANAVEVEDGRYRADAFAFTMAGDWVLSVEADLADGTRVRGEAATTVRRP